MGSIEAPSNFSFRLSSTDAQCGWTSIDGGGSPGSGSIRFIGTLIDNSTTISEDIAFNPASLNELEAFNFSSGIWNNQDLIKVDIEVLGAVNYFAFDNLFITDINSITLSTDTAEQENVTILQSADRSYFEILRLDNRKIDYQLYDVTGKLLSDGIVSSNSNRIQVYTLSQGIYFLILNKSSTHKLLKR